MSFTVELAPVDQEKHKAFKRQLSKDFYLSFKFSQGNSPVQEYIYRALTDYYRSQPDYDPSYIRENSIDLQSKLMRFRLPTSHTVKTSDGRDFDPTSPSEASAFMAQSSRFVKVLNSKGDLLDDRDLNIETITRGLIRRDRVYQVAERGYQAPDPHSSYFRQYVLLGEPTGSAAYDHIFARAAELLEVDRYSSKHNTLPLSDVVSKLASGWEHNHPGESFLPADNTY
jgi:hypothetical protein